MINDKALIDSIQKIFKILSEIQGDIKIMKSDISNLNDEVVEIKKELKKVNNRIDLLGKQVSNLDEDAPSSEDFSNLEKRVTKIEQRVVFA